MPFVNAQQVLLKQLSENTFVHTSYLQTDDYGHVPCNGLVVRNGHQALIFDTPTDDQSAKELIRLVQDSLQCKIMTVVPTHFHSDCLGGLKAFHEAGIPSIANELTLDLAKNSGVEIPKNGFRDSLTLEIGSEKVWIKFLGQGHTRDNVVGYFPSEDVLFGGCLIKELGASKGYLGDANVDEWSATVKKVKKEFPRVKRVVPGHGEAGDSSLLDYTQKLFTKQN
jgi:metallo-beta-lactamase class B